MSILPPDPDSKRDNPPGRFEPTLSGVVEMMIDRASARDDAFLDRVSSLMFGVADSHKGLNGCDSCDDGERACPYVETITEIALAWLMSEAKR